MHWLLGIYLLGTAFVSLSLPLKLFGGEQTKSDLKPRYRYDLLEKLSRQACDPSFQFRPNELWKLEIFDTQGVFTLVEGKASELTDKAVLELAFAQSREEQHRGFAWGHCRPGQAWFITTPSPFAALNKGSELSPPQLAETREACHKLEVSFAPPSGRQIHSLTLEKTLSLEAITRTWIAQAGQGTLSLTCHPQDSRWGPQLWALRPLPAGFLGYLPEAKQLQAGQLTLLSWIQKRRQELGLPLLSINPKNLKSWRAGLPLPHGILHPHRWLEVQTQTLLEKDGFLIGENRVTSEHPEEGAWLLWNSPEHRSLMLDEEANVLVTKESIEKQNRTLQLLFIKLGPKAIRESQALKPKQSIQKI